MNRLNMCALCLAGLLVTQVLIGQEKARSEDPPVPATNFISDDDGGVVQIVPVGSTTAGLGKANISPVMKSIRQVSVFLGSGWAQPSVLSRTSSLTDLARDTHLARLPIQNVDVLPASSSVHDFADLSRPVNDLTIQRKLVEMLEHNTLPSPDASTVFVIFLAPGVKMTVGNHTAGVHFAAYHNLIHVEAGELRYVVVPFDKNASHHATAASLAIVDTVFNPASY